MCFLGHELQSLSKKIVLMNFLPQYGASPGCPHWQPGSVHVEAGVNIPALQLAGMNMHKRRRISLIILHPQPGSWGG